ncbi:metallophosphoesterase [Methanobrevibacter sp.]|uniref:metallophosphoesterase n=1 Tax=Methanobrevibacter sp. TaxID=66852 RepID=UPI0025E376A2|nr:metallophosphoesterase [Methanobrevibacter sp.]MBR4448053.1 metallophosphoesterase [Methanobrevibacter sp.]
MSFRTKRVLFATPFYMLFEFFLLKYLLLLVGGLSDIYLLLITMFIGLNHFLPMLFEIRKSRKITRFLTTIDGVWLWASVMFLIDIIIIYLVGSFITLPLIVIILALAIVPILGVYNYWKAHRLVVNEETLKFNNLQRDINIAHLSDIHFGSVRHKKIISDIKDKLNTLDCELAIISGDLADGSSVVEEDDFIALKDVKMPIIFTPGNHDFYPGIENVIKACKKAGIIVLDNESMEFECLNIYGLPFSIGDRNILQFDGSLIKPDMLNIINYHVPYYWDEFSDLGFDIQLSGHTHGGQFYPAVWFGNLMFGYNMGLFKNKLGRYLHVTTGVGSMDTPMRWGTDSEIVVLKLKRI